MVKNFNSIKQYIENYARSVAADAAEQGKSTDEILRNTNRMPRLLEAANLQANTEQLTLLLHDPKIKELAVKDNENENYADAVLRKIKELNSLVAELPSLIAEHHQNIDKILETEKEAKEVLDQYAEQSVKLKELAFRRLQQQLAAARGTIPQDH